MDMDSHPTLTHFHFLDAVNLSDAALDVVDARVAGHALDLYGAIRKDKLGLQENANIGMFKCEVVWYVECVRRRTQACANFDKNLNQ
jgi:hypothetical protein